MLLNGCEDVRVHLIRVFGDRKSSISAGVGTVSLLMAGDTWVRWLVAQSHRQKFLS